MSKHFGLIILASVIPLILCLNYRDKRQTITCKNSGEFNFKTLNCDCFPSYTGNDCSQLQCQKADPISCDISLVNYCDFKKINDYCPKLCNRCNCQLLSCQNNGIFNNNTCVCDCFPSYSGKMCENLNCKKPDPLSCKSYSAGYCMSTYISSYCPILCGKCSTAPPICPQILECQNSGIFNKKTCKCDCLPSYIGNRYIKFHRTEINTHFCT
jgi:hypothetical protein